MAVDNASLDLRLFDKGIQLGHEILWLDSPRAQGQVSFLSSLLFKKRMPRAKDDGAASFIASEEAARLLSAWYGYPRQDLLGCPFFRPIALGTLSLELMPQPLAPLGTSSLYMETPYTCLFYVGYDFAGYDLPTSLSQKPICKPAEHCLVHAYTPLSLQDERSTQQVALWDRVEALWAKHHCPVILYIHPLWIKSLEVLLSCFREELWLHPLLNKLLKSTQRASPLPRSFQGLPRRSLLLWPHTLMKLGLPRELKDLPQLCVQDTRELNPGAFWGEVVPFDAYTQASLLLAKLKKIAPHELHFAGPYAKSYALYFKKWFPKSKPHFLYNKPTLF